MKILTAQLLVSTLALVLLLVACAPAAAPPLTPPQITAASTPAPAAPATASLAKAAWELGWERVVAEAKKEGVLVLITSLGGQQRQIVANPFTSKYGVRIEAVSGGGALLFAKILSEQRAGIYSGDVYIGGTTAHVQLKGALDSLEPVLILPELTEPELIKKTWYFGELPWADKARTGVISLMDFQLPISVNPNVVKAGEVATYRDLLDPKWKGRISLFDPRSPSMGTMWFAAVLELGDVDVNYMRELIKQELFITRDGRLQVEWLAHGKHAIALGPHTATVTEFIQLGAPIKRFNIGTSFVSGSTSDIVMPKRAPHPNAARLFINWLLSQEGQTFHSQAVGSQSQRLDVLTTHLEPSKVLKPGLKLYRADNEEFAVKRETFYIQLAKEVFGP